MPSIQDQIRSLTDSFSAGLADEIQRAAVEAVQKVLGTSKAPAASKPAAVTAPGRKTTPTKAAPVQKLAPVATRAKKTAPTKLAPVAKKPAQAAPAPQAPAKKVAPTKRALGAKRPPAELAALVEKLGNYIEANPGQGAEAISKGLSVPSNELSLPIRKLLAAQRIRSEGKKSATKYFPV